MSLSLNVRSSIPALISIICELKQTLLSDGGKWCLSAEYELVNLEFLCASLKGCGGSFQQIPYFRFLRHAGLGKHSKLVSESLCVALVADQVKDVDLFEAIVESAVREVFTCYRRACSDMDVSLQSCRELSDDALLVFFNDEIFKPHADAAFSAGRCGAAIQREAICVQQEILVQRCYPELYQMLGWHYEQFLSDRFGGEMVTMHALRNLCTHGEIELSFSEQWQLYLREIAVILEGHDASRDASWFLQNWQSKIRVS